MVNSLDTPEDRKSELKYQELPECSTGKEIENMKKRDTEKRMTKSKNT